MKRDKKSILYGHSSVRNRFRIFRRIIAAILLIMFSIVAIMCLGSMDDTVEGGGTVVGIREYDLKTLVSAKTVKIYHHEGEEVKRGELLVEFDSRDQRDKIATLKHELEELIHEQEVKEQSLKILRKDPLPDYFRHTKLQLEEARERFARNEHELKVYHDLFQRKAITRREFLRVELDHLNSQMALRRLQEDWKKLQSGMAKDIILRAEKELALLKKRIEGKKLDIDIAIKKLEDYKLYAPDAGVLTDIPPRAGGFYPRGEVVVKFSANRNKKVIALIDEKQIFKVAPGQKVRIYCQQYNYLDYGYFEGRVTDIYQLPVMHKGANCYPVRIVLSNEEYPLRFGSGCDVTIITGRDRIISVILGIRGKGFWERRLKHLDKKISK
ncbi:MAG: HlyD family efflux transporter periplasmic adaptor subunit [Lentisphaeria bacterium]|nr:HlyD family efflux transporter periplasmic adaptor subunit [Lentisphaeria bacterium]